MVGDAMRLRPLVWDGSSRQPGHSGGITRRRKYPIWALLALGGSLPVLAWSGELDFSVVQVETHQAFQRYDGFQLATLAHTPEVNIRVNRLEDRIKRHTHPRSHHFLYVIKGRIVLSVGDEKRVVGAG